MSSQGTELLFGAVKRDDLEEMVKLLNRSASFCRPDLADGHELLHCAIQYGRAEIAKFLLQKGAKVNREKDKERWLLHSAVKGGYLELVDLLINNNGDLNSQDFQGETPLHIAVKAENLDVVKILIHSNADINSQNSRGETPLHNAIETKNLEVVKILLDNNVDVNARNSQGETSLYTAIQELPLVQLLLKSKMCFTDQVLCEALFIASYNGHQEIVICLLTAGASPNASVNFGMPCSQPLLPCMRYGPTPLFAACGGGHSGIVKHLLRHGAKINYLRPDDKHSPLHVAAEGPSHLAVCLLLDNGANSNAKADDNVTPLHLATEAGCIETVDLLLKRGAQVNYARLSDCYTPLHLASRKFSPSVVRLLLKYGANVNAKASDASTPLHLAIAGERVDSEIVECLLKHGAEVNCLRLPDNCTPLHIVASNSTSSCRERNVKICEALLNNGGNPNAKALDNTTPLHLAAENGCLEIVKLLLDNSSDINAQNHKGSTPLLLASRNKHKSVIEILLKYGAFVSMKDKNNDDALYFAVKAEDEPIITNILDSKPEISENVIESVARSILYHCEFENRDNDWIDNLLEYSLTIKAEVGYYANVLLSAVKTGDLKIVQTLLKNGVNPNDERLDPLLLHYAVENGHKEIVELLLASDWNVNAQDSSGYTHIPKNYSPLHVACENSTSIRNIDIATALLNSGADPDAKASDDTTPLHLAAQNSCFAMVKQLINYSANVNVQNSKGSTPLLLASKNKHKFIVKILLEHGALVDIKDENNDDALYFAVEAGEASIINNILEYKPHISEKCIESVAHSILNSSTLESLNNKWIDNLIEFSVRIDHGVGRYANILLSAVKKGRVKIVKTLLMNGARPKNERFDPFLLHHAVGNGHEEIVNLLLTSGWDVNAKDGSGNTPIHYSLRCIDSAVTVITKYKCFEVCRLLLNNGADIKDSPQLLHAAIVKKCGEICRALVEKGADVNFKNENNETALHCAINGRSEDVAILLIEFGADLNSCDQSGKTPLHLAIQGNYVKIVESLLKNKADANLKNENDKSPLFCAITRGLKEIAILLIQFGADVNFCNQNGESLLQLAIQRKLVKIVEVLLKHNVDMNFKNKNDETALHCALNGSSEDLAVLLIEYGADVNSCDQKGDTPLHLAIQRKFTKIVEVLLKNKADVNLKNNKDETALHCALTRGSGEIAILLIEFGADVNCCDQNGETPLHLAIQAMHVKIVKILLLKKADVNFQNKKNETPLHCAVIRGSEEKTWLLIESGAKVNSRDQNGKTPLDLAVHYHYVDIVNILLKNKADVNLRSKDGQSLLHVTAQNGYCAVANLLVEFGADVDALTNLNETALHYAFKGQYDNHSIDKVLLDSGINVNVEDSSGRTALDLAISQKHSYRNCFDTDNLKKHIIKLKVAGCHVSRHNLQLLQQDNSELQHFRQKCREEVKRLKYEKFSRYFTLHDVLRKQHNPAYARDESLLQTLISWNYEDFPIYRNLILSSLKKSKQRNELLTAGLKWLDVLLKTSNEFNENQFLILPPELLEKIVSNLSNEEISRLCFCGEDIKIISPK